MRSNIEKELQTFKNLGVGCIFVFNGLEFGKKEYRTPIQPPSVRSFEQAWELYDQQQADQVVDAFSNAGMLIYSPFQFLSLQPTSSPVFDPHKSRPPSSPDAADQNHPSGTPPPETLYKFLQRILHQNGVSFMVAPYSAAAQVSTRGVDARSRREDTGN